MPLKRIWDTYIMIMLYNKNTKKFLTDIKIEHAKFLACEYSVVSIPAFFTYIT